MRRRRARVRPARLISALLPPGLARAATRGLPKVALPKAAVPKAAVPRPVLPRARAPKAAVGPSLRITPTRPVGRRPGGTPAAPGKGRWEEFRHLGPAGARSYAVYVPYRARRTTALPMVVLLHGCGQTTVEFAEATRFNELADRNKVILVYPQQTPGYHAQRCWRWFERAHQNRGMGEPGILAGITREVIARVGRWRIDPSRVYVAGLSAGGAMSLILGMTYPDLFAAVGAHSAPPFRSATSAVDALAAMAGRSALPRGAPFPAVSSPAPPLVVFQGGIDPTVRAVNSRRVAEQWLARHAAACAADPRRRPVVRSRVTTGRTRGSLRAAGPVARRYTVTRWYTSRGWKALEVWDVDGLGHAWSGGRSGSSFSDPSGPRATTQMWRFFASHRLTATVVP